MDLLNIAKKHHSGDHGTKPISYYERYQNFLNQHSISPEIIFEVGVYNGESARIFSEAFPNSLIICIDIDIREIDFSSNPNILYLKADQSNPDELESIINTYQIKNIDLVIDDASHFGWFSKITFDALFPLVRSGGAYFVEDWGTGYWDSWIDGSRFQQFPIWSNYDAIPKRIPSHDFGMVGFVKSLVDLTHESAIKNNQSDSSIYTSRIKALEFGEGVCMALKS